MTAIGAVNLITKPLVQLVPKCVSSPRLAPELKSRQAPELSDETQHPSSTDGGDTSGKIVWDTLKSVYSGHHE